MDINSANLVINKALKQASGILGIEFVEYTILDGNKFQNENIKSFFERYYYLIKFNKNWLIEANEKEIIVETYKQVRHAYQQFQIEFRDKLLEIEAVVEEEDTIKCWEEELSYYTEEDDVEDEDFIQQSTQIDSFAFAKLMLKKANCMELDIPNVIKENVEKRIIEISNNNL